MPWLYGWMSCWWYLYDESFYWGTKAECALVLATLAVPDRFTASGEPGSRAPHLWVDRDGVRLSTLDLYERTCVLLTGP
ncbi:hypothetical protein [Streptomyces milbemycinicus]|uniref:hypothetical protein n=1 Tax=Streptomyces milbemycinicus TaxID=476552 RepID=UPI0033ED71B8